MWTAHCLFSVKNNKKGRRRMFHELDNDYYFVQYKQKNVMSLMFSSNLI